MRIPSPKSHAPEKMVRENSTSLHFRELAALLLTAAQLHIGYSTGRCSSPRPGAFSRSITRIAGLLESHADDAAYLHGVHKAILTLVMRSKTLPASAS